MGKYIINVIKPKENAFDFLKYSVVIDEVTEEYIHNFEKEKDCMVLGIVKLSEPTVVKFCKLNPDAIIPSKAHDTDAGYDFFSIENVTIPAHSNAVIDTGIAWECEDRNCYLQVKSRSGLAFKRDIECTNAGVIDWAYRGAIKVKLYNDSDEYFTVNKGDKIAQGIVVSILHTTVKEVETLSETDRGNKGFGSSGV